jgi:hypothetical protein
VQNCPNRALDGLGAKAPAPLLRSLKRSTVIQAKVRNSGKPFPLAAALTISVLDAI